MSANVPAWAQTLIARFDALEAQVNPAPVAPVAPVATVNVVRPAASVVRPATVKADPRSQAEAAITEAVRADLVAQGDTRSLSMLRKAWIADRSFPLYTCTIDTEYGAAHGFLTPRKAGEHCPSVAGCEGVIRG